MTVMPLAVGKFKQTEVAVTLWKPLQASAKSDLKDINYTTLMPKNNTSPGFHKSKFTLLLQLLLTNHRS